MKFYAKSEKSVMKEKEREQASASFRSLRESAEGILTGQEEEILQKAEMTTGECTGSRPKMLSEHLKETEQCAEFFFKQYGRYFSEKQQRMIQFVCRYHDIGKMNMVMQAKMGNKEVENWEKLKKLSQIPHGYLGALSISEKLWREIEQNWGILDYQVVLTVIYYHHTRRDDFADDEIEDFANEYYVPYLNEYAPSDLWEFRVSSIRQLLFRSKSSGDSTQHLEEKKWMQYAVCKGMLNKFDWCASAEDMESEIHPDLVKKELKQRIEKLRTPLRPVQEFMRDHAEDNLVIVAPTGSGKTEAALLWLNGEKGFYTLPIKVSANAIYERIKDQYEFRDTALVHSDSLTEYLKERADTDDGYAYYEKARRLSYPLTVCTVDQIFQFIYKSLGTEIFAATLSYSKVIIDEIQAYSPELIADLIYGLKLIRELGGKYAVITATFPPVLRMFMDQQGLNRGEGGYIFQDFSRIADMPRHMIEISDEDFVFENILQEASDKKVLVICNTVSQAQNVYHELKQLDENSGGNTEIYLLHSRYIRTHKELLEQKIMQCSEASQWKGIWISTQIVEASLDIDFDLLYTEMCTCDSLLQRMGRCNRRGLKPLTKANIIIINNQNGVGRKSVYDPELVTRALEYLRDYEGMIFTEVMKEEYIAKVYDPQQMKGTDYYKVIKDRLKHLKDLQPEEYTLEETRKDFRKISSIAVIPDCIYNQYTDFFEKGYLFLQNGSIGKDAKALVRRKLTDLTLNINRYGNYFPDGIDKDIIRVCGDSDESRTTFFRQQPLDIHRSRLLYEFDASVLSGRGLVLGKTEDEDYMI